MEAAYLIVGLGNPGREYAGTLHNAGFILADRLAGTWKGEWRSEKKFEAQVARVVWNQANVLLCEPWTFMNESGRAVGKVSEYFRIGPEKILVLVDDAD